MLFEILLCLGFLSVTGSPSEVVNYGIRGPRNCLELFEKSIAENSTVVRSSIYLSRLHTVETAKSSIFYTVVENSYVGSSSLNASFTNPDLTNCDPDEIFCNSDRYCFNRVYDSLILNSEVGYIHQCKWHPYNSTIIKSNINLSGVQNSLVSCSKFCDSLACTSAVCDSEITNGTKILNSAVTGTDTSSSGISYSQTKLSTVVNSCISETLLLNSNVTSATVSHSRIEDSVTCFSNVTDACIKNSEVMLSNVRSSDITSCVKVSRSEICNSTIAQNSDVFESEVLSSTISNSSLCDVVVVNSSVTGQHLRSVKIINNTLCG